MNGYIMGDKASPPTVPADLPVWAFYAGGQTPTPYTRDQVAALRCRWALPIWVAIDTTRNANADAIEYVNIIRSLGWGKNTTVAVDTEAVIMGQWLAQFDRTLKTAGYDLLHYESRDAAAANPPTSGGKWVATWDNRAVLPPGTAAVQYATSAMAGTPWDLSLISPQVPLHELNPIASPGLTEVALGCKAPRLSQGMRGWAVRQLQALLVAAMPDVPPMGLDDGEFGPITRQVVADWQLMYGVSDPAGTVGADTWASLITRL